MIYTTGTVNTVSGSAIVRGTGTKFKNNNPAINIGMTILIKSGNTNIPYMIKSVNSDTELVLAQPALATATNTTFSIHITEPDNNSDAARTMVAINAYTQYFLDAMNTWMSETGQTKIEMPNGEVITLDSITKMQEDIGKKFDKTGGRVTGSIISERNINAEGGLISAILGDVIVQLKSTGGYPSILSTYDNKKFNELKLPDSSGVAMTLGQNGWGGFGINLPFQDGIKLQEYIRNIETVSSVFRSTEFTSNLNYRYSAIAYFKTGNTFTAITASHVGQGVKIIGGYDASEAVYTLYTDKNTMVDTGGFIKKASPIIDINPDGTFTTNDESEGATVTRVAKGEYLIEGVLGFNADAGWGGVDGGIEIPLDVNKQPLIWVNSEVNKDGSILVKTYHRTHPNAPEFARNDIDGYSDGDPIDIPNGRFISVRVQMPEQSIYNVRMREMEEAQKVEEECRQKEEEENQDTNSAPEIDN
ncbi:hypothetical protein [Proteus terrae]|uniref:phage tail fiber protein n=1 Tax=Proteus terrae TaxID=1574161 RepID=UPI0034E4680A